VTNSDSYSFGMVFSMILTKEQPISSSRNLAVNFPSEVPHQLCQPVVQCLKHNPDERPSSQDLVKCLKMFLET